MLHLFICWADPSHRTAIAIVKFHPFSLMDPALKAQYKFLSQHLIAQAKFQNPNKSNGPAYSGDMYSLGWRKGYEAETKVGIQGISAKVRQDQLGFEDLQTHVPQIDNFIGNRFQSVSQPLFDKVKLHHQVLQAPGLAPHFERDDNSFTSHLSFTIGAFANTPHMDTDASPLCFVMWIPTKKDTGNLVEENLQVKGGQFIFPGESCGIDFTGFDGIVECAWKATSYSHFTLPSQTSSDSQHTQMGLSVQLPKKTERAFIKIRDHVYENDPEKRNWIIRDIGALLDQSC